MIKAISISTSAVFVIFLLFFSACENAPSEESSSNNETEAPTEDSTQDKVTLIEKFTPPLPDCQPEGSIIEGNRFWADEEKLLIVLKADPSTEDDRLGESHRILEVYDEDCQLIQKEILPVNRSADFPYHIASITYNNSNQLLAIYGFDVIRFYDIKNRKLSPAIQASFPTGRYSVDAQSGMIEHLELWEQYLVGHARDQGGFVFDLTNSSAPEAVMPISEYEYEERFHSLFALKSDDGGQQLIMPNYNKQRKVFEINAILDKPTLLSTNNIEKNDRFLIVGTIDDRLPIAIDLLNRSSVDLPEVIMEKTPQEMLKWMQSEL